MLYFLRDLYVTKLECLTNVQPDNNFKELDLIYDRCVVEGSQFFVDREFFSIYLTKFTYDVFAQFLILSSLK